MEQLTFFDLQNDPSTGSFCDGEETISTSEALLLVEKEVRAQELREAYVKTLAPDAYSLFSDDGKNRPTLTYEELLLHVAAVREKRLCGVDLSDTETEEEAANEERELTPATAEKALSAKESAKTQATGLIFFAKQKSL